MLDFPPKEMMSIKCVKALIRKYLACRPVCFNGYLTPNCILNFKMVLKFDCSFMLSKVYFLLEYVVHFSINMLNYIL